jgi:hypothetical protein
MVPGGGQPTVSARQVVGVSGHAGDAPALAPLDGGEALDLCTTARASADRQEAPSAHRSLGTRKSAVGRSTHYGRAEGLGIVVSATTVKKILREEQPATRCNSFVTAGVGDRDPSSTVTGVLLLTTTLTP